MRLKPTVKRHCALTADSTDNRNNVPLHRRGKRPGDIQAAFWKHSLIWQNTTAGGTGSLVPEAAWAPLSDSSTRPSLMLGSAAHLKHKHDKIALFS